MRISIVKGGDARKAEINIRNLNANNAHGIRKAFYKLGKDLRSLTKQEILKKPRSGRTYLVRRGSRIIQHTASRPGEYPASLSGNLQRSVDFNVYGADRMEFGYIEGYDENPSTGFTPKGGVTYGKYLEEGTSRMQARPGLQLSVKKTEGNAREHFETELKKHMSKI